MTRAFAHLHVASAFSLRYGTAFPAALVRRAAEHGMDTLALTDRDGLYGAIKHVIACHEQGVRPVVGVDLALDGVSSLPGSSVPGSSVPDDLFEGGLPSGRRTGHSRGHGHGHGHGHGRGAAAEPARVVVLARTGGWAALCRLVTAAHHAGERGAPYVTPGMVAEHATGPDGEPRLTVLLGPRSGVGRAVAERHDDQARTLLAAWRAVVPDLVVEVSDLYGYRDASTAARMIGLADSMGVPVVLTNAVRYLDAADHQVGNVLDAARKLVPLDGRHLDDPTAHAYLKDGAEMARVAARICGGDTGRAARLLAETRRVADLCVLDPVEIVPLLDPERPRLHLPEVGEDPVPLLRRRCEEGLARRGLERSAEARDRLAAELHVIEKKRLSGYFTSVAGITDMIRAMGVRCAIRGSGASSLVNYLIGIGEVNPLEHGLLMERFLSEGRKGLPDIDIDVESARRLDCYRAILDRYGEDRVACVSMMETYRARSAIRDVGAAMGLPPHEIDVIAKAFPQVRARQIRAALSDLPELRDSGLNDRSLETVFRLAERLDGLPRHIALHPCGVLIGNSTLRDRTPVERSMLDFPMSQFDKDDVEEAGLLKLDVLGVRMQSALAYALQEVERVENRKIDLDAVPRDDRETYDMIRLSRTIGCFQIESPGQRELVAKLEPRTMHDLIVDISLFRPGPVNSDMVTPYLETRHGFREARYPHESLRDALRETNGVVVFHEQVMKVIDVMTGAGLSEADRARRALGTPEGREAVRAWFVPLAKENGYADDVVEQAWKVLDAFGGFGFCKAHAAAFALPTYQSAWLKRHHTAAFLAGVLTHDPGMYPSRVILDEARQCGVDVLPLDVNRSGKTWLVERTSPAEGGPVEGGPVEGGPVEFGRGYGLRVPFSAVRGVSEAEVERMVAGRPYTSLADFWERARPSRPVAERIVEVGGFDALHGLRPGEPRWRPGRLTRRDLIAQVGALDRGSPVGVAGQLPMGFTDRVTPGELPEMTEAEAVEAELEILGMDVSHHVMDFYRDLLDAIGVTRARDLLRQRNGAEILVAGVKVATQTPAVRSGQRVIFTTLDDSTGPIDLTFFESVQAHTAATVFGSWLLAARGVVRRTGGRAVSLRAVHCWNLADLDRVWRTEGLDAVRALISEVPVPGAGVGGRPIEYGNGFRVSPYSDNGAPPAVREGRLPGHPSAPQRRLWHASSGSSGPPPGR
ncbi:DNA polymerase III subunit alpha [Microbispora sp. SCL1-1]|uniref:DNA polymerase III subunit alpha n=1 Tax=unclassified Microbispora TaxID=2614687 RepID=UPI00115A617C|nr:DNA polymerase III subunit alpha [Microbispora sp. SCL1-1]NJP27700.1 DNA polymerase III subunit alpha [Microbispora sp. CL1-1]TQS10705.1 DNA polymerase III subunit alpha [Microbispora sp. SCL1-1]